MNELLEGANNHLVLETRRPMVLLGLSAAGDSDMLCNTLCFQYFCLRTLIAKLNASSCTDPNPSSLQGTRRTNQRCIITPNSSKFVAAMVAFPLVVALTQYFFLSFLKSNSISCFS